MKRKPAEPLALAQSEIEFWDRTYLRALGQCSIEAAARVADQAVRLRRRRLEPFVRGYGARLFPPELFMDEAHQGTKNGTVTPCKTPERPSSRGRKTRRAR